MPPAAGGPDQLYDGLVQGVPGGPLYIAERESLPANGIPRHSTMFWRSDRDLVRDEGSKRIRYRYPTDDGGRTLTFVGFQEPLPVIPAGTLLRVSLAHWWRPEDHPEDELRCYVQLSGWFSVGAQAVDHQGADADASALAPAAATAAARGLLKAVFGYDDFLPLQAEVVANVLAAGRRLRSCRQVAGSRFVTSCPRCFSKA